MLFVSPTTAVLRVIITVCPTLIATASSVVAADANAGTKTSFTVNVAVSAATAAGVVTSVYLVCSLPCSAHLIRSELEGISAPTILRNEDTVLFP